MGVVVARFTSSSAESSSVRACAACRSHKSGHPGPGAVRRLRTGCTASFSAPYAASTLAARSARPGGRRARAGGCQRGLQYPGRCTRTLRRRARTFAIRAVERRQPRFDGVKRVVAGPGGEWRGDAAGIWHEVARCHAVLEDEHQVRVHALRRGGKGVHHTGCERARAWFVEAWLRAGHCCSTSVHFHADAQQP